MFWLTIKSGTDGDEKQQKLSRDQATRFTRSALERSPSSSISAANTEQAAVLQPSAAGAKAVRRTYLKISADKKAEIRERAAQHGVIVTVYYRVYTACIFNNECNEGGKT